MSTETTKSWRTKKRRRIRQCMCMDISSLKDSAWRERTISRSRQRNLASVLALARSEWVARRLTTATGTHPQGPPQVHSSLKARLATHARRKTTHPSSKRTMKRGRLADRKLRKPKMMLKTTSKDASITQEGMLMPVVRDLRARGADGSVGGPRQPRPVQNGPTHLVIQK